MSEATPIAARLTAQALAGEPLPDSVAVAGRLLAVQAQDPRGVRLAVRARTAGTAASDVDRALGEERSVVIDWLNRGTLHLVRSEDHAWLHALTTPPLLTANRRRLSQEGVGEEESERALARIERALADEGPLTRAELRERLDAEGIPTAGQALVHLLYLATLRGVAVRGPVAGRDQAFVLARDWLGPAPRFDREVALAELARRYLAGHAPADDRDLARWAGLPLRDSRAGLEAIAGELLQREDGLLELRVQPPPRPLPGPLLLGAFDPLLLGWRSREDVIGPHRRLVTNNGIFRPFALVGGRAVATWGYAAGKVTLKPLEPLAARDERALAADAAAVERFLAGWPR